MTLSPQVNLHIFDLPQKLGQAAAQLVADISAQAVAARGRFVLALSGGSLPNLMAPPLIHDPLRTQVEWPAWHVFWADERCVPLDHPDSNYQGAKTQLFDQVDIPPDQIYPLKALLAPAAAATAYQASLTQILLPEAGQLPCFDLVLLGMGEDGHTASLFPNHPLLHETRRWVPPIFDSPKPPPERITLTLPVINNARRVIFVATGAGKAEILPQILKPTTSPSRLPAALVQPKQGLLDWFVDLAAATNLHRPNA